MVCGLSTAVLPIAFKILSEPSDICCGFLFGFLFFVHFERSSVLIEQPFCALKYMPGIVILGLRIVLGRCAAIQKILSILSPESLSLVGLFFASYEYDINVFSIGLRNLLGNLNSKLDKRFGVLT